MLIAGFYYYNEIKKKEKVSFILAFLRFLSLFLVLLLIINPKINIEEVEVVKPKLIVAVDNSSSIKYLSKTDEVFSLVEHLKSHVKLNSKFDLDFYSFSKEMSLLDTLNFDGVGTDISNPLRQFKSIYNNSDYPIVLVTDGNQTLGANYEYSVIKQPVFSVVVGDTTKYADLEVAQLNANKYSYLNNKFPVEVFLNYQGSHKERALFTVYDGKAKVYSKVVDFSNSLRSQSFLFYLASKKIGVHYYSAQIEYLKNERNIINNKYNFTVEVIDEQSKTLLVTSFLHPDLGSFKKSIEANEQRSVDIKFVGEEYNLKDYNSVILYQPSNSFKSIFDQIKSHKLNCMIVTGSRTDWNFLNASQFVFSKKVINQTESYSASYNPAYPSFSQDDIGFEFFPPLVDAFGEVSFQVPTEILLWKKVGSFLTKQPLLTSYEHNNTRVVLLFGENSWRWRMKFKVQNQDFVEYDNLMSKILQYLSSSKRTKRLLVDSETLYNSNDEIRIRADFMDKNYQFDPSASLWIKITNVLSGKVERIPFSLSRNKYSVVIPFLEEGDYDYIVSVDNENAIQKGRFRIVNFDIEKQFSSSNVDKLKRVSEGSNGGIYYLNTANLLVDKLMADNRFSPIQKSHIKIKSLIEWKWLLGLIILSLSLEWFIRKYTGLI